MAFTPDFDSHPIEATITSAVPLAGWVEVVWSDGRASRFHHIWLRDNCPCEQCVHPVTREQMFEIISVPADLRPQRVWVDEEGSLAIAWPAVSDVPAHESHIHPGWLRRHAYDDASRQERSLEPVTWDASTMPEPPTFDGRAIMEDDDALYEWLVALRTWGVSVVQNVPCEVDAIADLVARIGIVRETNFGVLWDVRSEPDPISNANTSLALPPHVDLPTREYQPGLQFLHCIVNETEGGENILVDGFRIAERIRAISPADYAILTTVPFQWANRSATSDYRWDAPIIVTNADGSLREVRVGNWLRAPLDVPFGVVEAAYAAYRRLFELTRADDLQLRFRLQPGEVMAFDNRRALHARGAFTDMSGRRFLRGCYSERDELMSRLRMIERERRACREAGAVSATRRQ
jgi:gamma-butyrobetaine dioxygenase